MRRKMLLHFRHTVRPWTSPKIAPAFSAYRPSLDIAENCSCIFGIPSIPGHKKSPPCGGLFAETRFSLQPAEVEAVGEHQLAVRRSHIERAAGRMRVRNGVVGAHGQA